MLVWRFCNDALHNVQSKTAGIRYCDQPATQASISNLILSGAPNFEANCKCSKIPRPTQGSEYHKIDQDLIYFFGCVALF